MGKNQAYKAMQRSKVSDGSSGLEQIDDGMVDGSFHSPEWHAARLASLGTSHTVTWEEFKRKQKEDEMKKGEVEADKDRMMKEYRAQLDAERAIKLAKGRNHSNTKSSDRKKDKEKDSRKRSKKHKRSRSSSSSEYSSDSESDERESRRKSKSRSKRNSSEYSGSESDERESRSKSKSRSKHKEKRHKSRSKTSSRGEKDEEGPLPLSRFFGSMKN